MSKAAVDEILDVEDWDWGIKVVEALKETVGARGYDGEASVQVLLPIQGGGCLRVTVSDFRPEVRCDRYKGLMTDLQAMRFECPDCGHKF